MSQDIYVGVDPGKHGGIVCLNAAGDICSAIVMPAHAPDLASVVRLHRSAFWTIERVGPIHVAGVKASFNFGYGAGIIEGILTALDVRFQLVLPKEWQKEMTAGVPSEKSAKERALISARRLWPTFDWPTKAGKPHDGVIDAALIARYGLKGL